MATVERACSQCGTVRTYSTPQAAERAERQGTRCNSCAKSEVAGLRKAILAAYGEGLTNREIATVVGCHHNTVAAHLRATGKTSHIKRGTPPEVVDEHHSRCRVCREVQPNDQFPLVRNRIDGRQLSMCRRCRREQVYAAAGASPEAHLANREQRMRRGERGARASRAGLTFDLPDGYLLALWRWQDGRCFYTGKQMTLGLGRGYDPSAVSVDRVDPARGYEHGNVVLCLNRVNSIKQDLTLEEMRDWMPGWHERVASALPLLVGGIEVIPDCSPRAANGRRLPTWIIERRKRLEALVSANGRS